MRDQVNYIIDRMLASKRGNVWSCTAYYSAPVANNGSGWLYTCKLKFKRIGRSISDELAKEQINRMLGLGATAGNAKGWLFPVQDKPTEVDYVEGVTTPPKIKPSRVYAENLPTDTKDYFNHIYGRENQISAVHSALTAFVDSNYNHRFHCVLWGEPACGKTEILKSFSRMLGNDAVLELDATSTTKAGAERLLLESENLPPVLICEEIEKTDEMSLRWLLGILDHRAEIRKVTNAGMFSREVKMLCLATVNDMSLFKRVMDGALASRFSNKIWCPRPSKEVLHQILLREIAKYPNGKIEWIPKAIDWCVDQEQTNDPRRVLTVCLCGRDKLLTGEYQEVLKGVMKPI